MFRRTTSIFSGRRPVYRRALGYLLLLLITYGVTVEVAQSHNPAAINRPQVAASGDKVAAPQSRDNGRSHSPECPLCQFQAQLFGSLVHAPGLLFTASIQIAFVGTETQLHLSNATIPTSGRAPPFGLA